MSEMPKSSKDEGSVLSSKVERIIQSKVLSSEVGTFRELTTQVLDLINEKDLSTWQAYLLCKLVSTQIQEDAVMGKKGFSTVSVYSPIDMFLSLCFLFIIIVFVQQKPYLISQPKYVLMLSVLVACFVLLISFVHSLLIKRHDKKND